MSNLDNPCSFNNKIILEAYQRDSGPRAEIRSGWASVGQKNNLKGLRVLIGAKMADGTFIPRDSTAYIREETLHIQSWASNKLKSQTIPEEFMVAPISEVEYFIPPSGDVIA